MGAGQIGGIATLLDIDFDNAAGFLGEPAAPTDALYIVYYLSHAMLFCTGAIIEAHIVLTPASCVNSERFKFEVYGGTHTFSGQSGVAGTALHVCVHRGYNHTARINRCSTDNVALLVLEDQYGLHSQMPDTEYVMNRLRYNAIPVKPDENFSEHMKAINKNCQFYGWGSRRNGFLMPLLIRLQRVDVSIEESGKCPAMFNAHNKFLCLSKIPCKSVRYGALCPDDLGTVLVCSDILRGLMTSDLIDRPCGVGFLDMSLYNKFISCGVDDSRDVLGQNDVLLNDKLTD